MIHIKVFNRVSLATFYICFVSKPCIYLVVMFCKDRDFCLLCLLYPQCLEERLGWVGHWEIFVGCMNLIHGSCVWWDKVCWIWLTAVFICMWLTWTKCVTLDLWKINGELHLPNQWCIFRFKYVQRCKVKFHYVICVHIAQRSRGVYLVWVPGLQWDTVWKNPVWRRPQGEFPFNWTLTNCIRCEEAWPHCSPILSHFFTHLQPLLEDSQTRIRVEHLMC